MQDLEDKYPDIFTYFKGTEKDNQVNIPLAANFIKTGFGEKCTTNDFVV